MKKYVSGVALLLAVLLLTVSAYAANDMFLFGPQVKKMDSGKVNKEVDLDKETSGKVSVHQKAGGKGTVEDSKKTSGKVLLNGEKVNVTEVSTFNVKKLIQSQSPQSSGMEATYSINDTLAADELGMYGDAGGNPWSLTRGETVEISLSWLPSDADLQVGLIDSDNTFYYVTFSDSPSSVQLTVNEADSYYVGIINVDTGDVSITGYVNI
ncbi:MAG: hypothetical protein IMW85_10105 [Thermicanus sp.]|nr:hypothetical protein [Thermicanus sp.]